jgi:hypothetical protein
LQLWPTSLTWRFFAKPQDLVSTMRFMLVFLNPKYSTTLTTDGT